ncbi:hypothetical protein HUG15_19985 [Salicibibacter cibarius]|uniref:Uncharacterized protein n=1 Tax=Salicibibacter cibarius TaxID=2743000 RepID=A0A7T6Z620_9BACI|nr:hypothetical protein [Salicibibacter cibarius]QQK77640.1 hypothetical protein HUG15_19985 [Salicibibacter cibarius]
MIQNDKNIGYFEHNRRNAQDIETRAPARVMAGSRPDDITLRNILLQYGEGSETEPEDDVEPFEGGAIGNAYADKMLYFINQEV